MVITKVLVIVEPLLNLRSDIEESCSHMFKMSLLCHLARYTGTLM